MSQPPWLKFYKVTSFQLNTLRLAANFQDLLNIPGLPQTIFYTFFVSGHFDRLSDRNAGHLNAFFITGRIFST